MGLVDEIQKVTDEANARIAIILDAENMTDAQKRKMTSKIQFDLLEMVQKYTLTC